LTAVRVLPSLAASSRRVGYVVSKREEAMEQDAGTTALAVRRAEDARYQAMMAGDVAALDRLLDPELVYTHSSATADSKSRYIEGVRSGLWKYRKIDRSEENIVVRDGVALVFNRVRIDIDVNGEPKALDNRILAVWVRAAADAWRLIAVHSTPIPKPLA
jgi:ketosteroid isomerase-like protein